MSFEKAQSFVALKEGGYTNDPRDAGNWTGGKQNLGLLIGTNHGISAPVLAAYIKAKYGRNVTKADMQSLTYSTALSIYKTQFWDKYNLDKIKSPNVQLIIYDGIVNQGIGNIQKIIQQSLSSFGQNVTISDSLRTKGIAIINVIPEKQLFETIKQNRELSYRKLSTFSIYGNGWLNRLKSLKYVEPTKEDDKPQTVNNPKESSPTNGLPIIILGLALSISGIVMLVKA
jgi:lysozyme family protein